MKTVTYKLWGVPHKAVKVASCTNKGEYTNYSQPQRNKK